MKALVHYKDYPSQMSTDSDKVKSKIVTVKNLEDLNGMFYFIESVQVITEPYTGFQKFAELK